MSGKALEATRAMQPRSRERLSVRLRLLLMISGQDEGWGIAEHSGKKEAGKQELRAHHRIKKAGSQDPASLACRFR